jgi:hypothetical protein
MRPKNSLPRARASPTAKRPTDGGHSPPWPGARGRPRRAESAADAKDAPAPGAYEEAPAMRSLRERLYGARDFAGIETDALDRLYCSLREYALQKGGRREYGEAQRAWALGGAVCAELHARHAPIDPDGPRGADACTRVFEEHLKGRFGDFDADSAARAAALKAEQEIQNKKFELFWETDMPSRYRKPSPALLQLRRREKCLAVCAEFERAKAVHEEAEALSAQERMLQQATLNRDYEAAKRRWLARQAAERELLAQTRAHERAILAEQCERDRDALNNRLLVVDTRKKEAEKGYRTANRPRPGIGRAGNFSLAYDRTGIDDVLLPPLLPPNDRAAREAERKRRREEERKKWEYQQQNAEATLRKYRLQREAQGAQGQKSQESGVELQTPEDGQPEPSASDTEAVLVTIVDAGEFVPDEDFEPGESAGQSDEGAPEQQQPADEEESQAGETLEIGEQDESPEILSDIDP